MYEQLSTFTRDYNSVRTALNRVEAFSKTCIETALNGIRNVISDEWNHTPCQVLIIAFSVLNSLIYTYLLNIFKINIFVQVLLITDGSVGVGAGSLKRSLETMNLRQSIEEKFPLPFSFPCKLHIVCIGNPSESDVRSALPYYQKLIDIGQQGGELFTIDGPISFK